MQDHPDFQPTQPAPTEGSKADQGDTGSGLFGKIGKALTGIGGKGSRLTGYVPPADEKIEPANAAPVLESQDLDPSDPLYRRLELAEEFRQIGDTVGARELLKEVVAKNAEGRYGKLARARLEQLDANSNPPLTLLDGHSDQPTALPNAPANPETPVEPVALEDRKLNLHLGNLELSEGKYHKNVNDPNSSISTLLVTLTSYIVSTKSFLDAAKAANKTTLLIEGVDLVATYKILIPSLELHLVLLRMASEAKSIAEIERAVAEITKANEEGLFVHPRDISLRDKMLGTLENKKAGLGTTPPAPTTPAPPQPAAATDPEMQRKIAEVERTREKLEDLLRARKLADGGTQAFTITATNQEIRDADHAAIRALEALYPNDQTYTPERREAFLVARDEILEMSGPYLKTARPPAHIAPTPPIAGGLPETPEKLSERCGQLLAEITLSKDRYDEERNKILKDKEKLIACIEELKKLCTEYINTRKLLDYNYNVSYYENNLVGLEQELTKLNRQNLGRRGALAAWGIITSPIVGAKKVGEEFAKLKKDLAENPEQKLEILKQRSLASAKYISALGIKGLDKYDKLSPKTKLAIGVGAAGLSIFTAMVPTIALRTVSVAAMSRKTYTKHMDKAFEKYKEAIVLADARKYFDEHQNEMPKTPNGQAIYFEEWIKTQNQDIENVKGKISLADFEKTSQYVDEWAKGLGKSAVMGLLVGVAIPGAIKNLDQILLVLEGMLPDGFMDPVKSVLIDSAAKAKEIGHATIKGLRNVIPAQLMTNLKVDMPRWTGGNLDYKTLESSKKSIALLKVYAKELKDKIEEVAREGDSSWKKERLEKKLLEFTKEISDNEKYINTLEKINDSTSVAGAPAGAGATGAGTGSATPPAGASTPTSTTTISPTITDGINLEKYPISPGDNLETLMKDRLGILEGLSPKQQENVIYNFFKTTAGDDWRTANGVTNIDLIITGKTLNLESLHEAIAKAKFTKAGGAIETLLERAKEAFPSQ